MSGTKAGGQKSAAKNLAKDPDFYKKIGAKGGKLGHTGGFAANPALASIAGKKGGTISRRKAAVKKDITELTHTDIGIEVFDHVPIREQAVREPVPTKQEVADGKVSRLIKRLFTTTSSK